MTESIIAENPERHSAWPVHSHTGGLTKMTNVIPPGSISNLKT